jgi:nitrate reductase NapE component
MFATLVLVLLPVVALAISGAMGNCPALRLVSLAKI